MTETEDVVGLRAALKDAPFERKGHLRGLLADALDEVGVVRVKCGKCCEGAYTPDGGFQWGTCPTCDGSGTVLDYAAPIEAALQRVLAEPDRDDLRLAYAAAVEPADPERAEFVRAQVEHEALIKGDPPQCSNTGTGLPCYDPDCPWGVWEARTQKVKERAEGLLMQTHAFRGRPVAVEWLPWEALRRTWLSASEYSVKGTAVCGGTGSELTFRRGFVEDVECRYNEWEGAADALMDAHPVRRVRFTTWPVIKVSDVPEPVDGAFRTRHAFVWAAIVGKLSARYPGITFLRPRGV